MKHFAVYMAEPLTDIVNGSIKRGEYPKIYKFEVSILVPKSYPTFNTSQLRNISGLLYVWQNHGKLISEIIIFDIAAKMDSSQYGNKKGVSIQHYIVKMIHRIINTLDNNSKGETFAVAGIMLSHDNV